MLGMLPGPPNRLNTTSTTPVKEEFIQDLLHWLAFRQTTTLTEEPNLDAFDQSSLSDGKISSPPGISSTLQAPLGESVATTNENSDSGIIKGHATKTSSTPGAAVITPPPTNTPVPFRAPSEDISWIGINGRCNKVADTCYAFWVCGSVGMLRKTHLMSFNGIRRWLLEKTQHQIGGFGKLPGVPPDILHSYLGLAALAVMKEPDLRSIDPTLCLSMVARQHLERVPWKNQGTAT